MESLTCGKGGRSIEGGGKVEAGCYTKIKKGDNSSDRGGEKKEVTAKPKGKKATRQFRADGGEDCANPETHRVTLNGKADSATNKKFRAHGRNRRIGNLPHKNGNTGDKNLQG